MRGLALDGYVLCLSITKVESWLWSFGFVRSYFPMESADLNLYNRLDDFRGHLAAINPRTWQMIVITFY